MEMIKKQTVSNPAKKSIRIFSEPCTNAEHPLSADEKQPVMYNKDIITETEEELQQPRLKRRLWGRETFHPDGLNVKTMAEIYDTVYPPGKPVVDGFLYNGTYIFAGAPKVGKSFFMAQLGYHVSRGIPLWDSPVTQGAVLYLALEDTEERLQKRLGRMFGPESSENLFFAVKAGALSSGLEGQLEQFLKEHADARLIIIDTLQKVKELGGDRFSYADDYQNVSRIKKFSDKYGICIILVHHTRKLDSSDSFERISGTNGLLGAADGAFVMQKEQRTSNDATLDIAGRDQQDQRMYLRFDRDHCLWQLTKTDLELWKPPLNPALEAVAGLLPEIQTEWSGSATELIRLLPEIEMEPNILTRTLNISVNDLIQEYGILYSNKHTRNGSLITLRKVEDGSRQKEGSALEDREI